MVEMHWKMNLEGEKLKKNFNFVIIITINKKTQIISSWEKEIKKLQKAKDQWVLTGTLEKEKATKR